MVRNGTDELWVPVSFTGYRKWLLKISHMKGFKPVFQTPELWGTFSGWGASFCCFSSCLLTVAVVQPREWGQGIWVRTETPFLASPDYLRNSCYAAFWLPAPALPWTGSEAPAVPLPSGHVQVKVLAGDTACCACPPEGGWVCVDVRTLAIVPSQSSFSVPSAELILSCLVQSLQPLDIIPGSGLGRRNHRVTCSAWERTSNGTLHMVVCPSFSPSQCPWPSGFSFPLCVHWFWDPTFPIGHWPYLPFAAPCNSGSLAAYPHSKAWDWHMFTPFCSGSPFSSWK